MVLPATNGWTGPAPEDRAALPTRRAAGLAPTRRSVWERVVEPYAAGAVLDDLVSCERVETACIRVLARFAVTRCVLMSVSGDFDDNVLRVETAIARAHLTRLARSDRERIILRRLLAAARDPSPSPRLIRYAALAAEQATVAGHEAGAHRLHNLSFMLALSAGWRRRAASIARVIAGHAARAGANAAATDWRRRAHALLEAC